MKKKIFGALAVVLVLCVAVGGTLAWLFDKTETITNTFTLGKVDIVLDELSNETGDRITAGGNQYQLIPGNTYFKDPTVTVKADSEACYLYVKFDDTNAATYLNYTSTLTVENGWTQGDGTAIPTNVWYREVADTNADQAWVLLAETSDDVMVTVKTNLTETQISAATGNNEPVLAYTAYAIQKANVATAAAGWAELNPAA